MESRHSEFIQDTLHEYGLGMDQVNAFIYPFMNDHDVPNTQENHDSLTLAFCQWLDDPDTDWLDTDISEEDWEAWGNDFADYVETFQVNADEE
jgi:hypothetical protein